MNIPQATGASFIATQMMSGPHPSGSVSSDPLFILTIVVLAVAFLLILAGLGSGR